MAGKLLKYISYSIMYVLLLLERLYRQDVALVIASAPPTTRVKCRAEIVDT